MQHRQPIHAPKPPAVLSSVAARRAVATVDGYMKTELGARALQFALDRKWIDALLGGPLRAAKLLDIAGASPRTGGLLIEILASSGVLRNVDQAIGLTQEFREALAHLDLLSAKLWFALTVAPDVHTLFAELFTDVPQFMGQARVFELFRYDRSEDVTSENLDFARQWVGYTTALTKYEGPVVIEALDLADRTRFLDVGGNSGEFARQVATRWPCLVAEVFDLPVVCRLGEEHMGRSPGAARVQFVPGDLRRDPLPGGYDALCFKSILHDWPDDYTASFLVKAAQSLEPGGRVIIFERAQIAHGGQPLPFSMVANLVFLPFFRAAELYERWLLAAGFEQIEVTTLELEMPFHLIQARKPT